MRIIIADQEVSFLKTLQSFLWDQGHETKVAKDALECLPILRTFRPDVLTLSSDLLWGGSDGLLEEMQSDTLLQTVPVLLLLGPHTMTPLRRHPLVVSTARRPFRMHDLIQQMVFVGLLRFAEFDEEDAIDSEHVSQLDLL